MFVIGKDVQKKWRSLRDSFKKELNLQKNTKSGQGKSNRRKYIYFEQLLFLEPTLEGRQMSGNYTAPMSNSSEEQETPQSVTKSTPKRPLTERPKKRKTPSYEESLLQILSDNKQEEIDEDKSFLLSLLPSFKQLSPQQKLVVKTQYLQVMHNVMYPHDNMRAPSISFHPHTPSINFCSAGASTSIQQSPQYTAFGNNPSYRINPSYTQHTQLPAQTHHQHIREVSSGTGNYYSSFSPSPETSQPGSIPERENILSPGSSTILSTSESELLDLY